jgi:glycosyltransferase involved in cell wall biosynthesis
LFVSVYMPVYNGGDYLRSAIESVLGQTHRDLEPLQVTVNDGSTDRSLAVLERYAAANCGSSTRPTRAPPPPATPPSPRPAPSGWFTSTPTI